jgi:SAM-dependent methyltransferase
MSSFGIHHLLLADRVRLRAVSRALRETVRPGDVVVDLGAGTGILGLLALRAGAGRVYAIERHPILRLARMLARENGVGDRVRFVKGDSRRVRLPERADLVVSDLVGPLGIDEEMADVVADARRFLRRGGKFLPARSEVWVAPVRAEALHRRHVRAGSGFGVRLGAFHTIAANCMAAFGGVPRGLAAPLRRAFVFDFGRDRAAFPRRRGLRFRVGGGTVHGLAIVVRVRLSRSVTMDSQFGSHWKPIFLPIRTPVETRRGDRLDAELVLHDSWNVEWRVGDSRQSTLFERLAYGR